MDYYTALAILDYGQEHPEYDEALDVVNANLRREMEADRTVSEILNSLME